MKLKSRIHYSYFLKRFLISAFILIAVAFMGFLVEIRLIVNQQEMELKARQQQKVLAEKNLMEHLFDEAVLDLLTMSESDFFQGFFTGKIQDETDCESFNNLLVNLFNQKESYYQLRHLDANGKEIFRIERRDGKPYICLENELQDKSERYYFKNSITLPKGQFYVSPFDLNVEQGQVELPYRPMIRICVPVFIEDGEPIGVNVLNFDGSNVFKELDNESLGENGMSYLINQDGYFLNAPDSMIEWGFMFADKKNLTIQTQFPEDFKQIQEVKKGQFKTTEGLYTVASVFPFKRLRDVCTNFTYTNDYQWKVFSFVPKDKLNYSAFLPLNKLIVLFLLVLIGCVVSAYLYARVAFRKYQAQMALVESERELSIANQTKNQFFSIIAHDLKNASGTITNYLEFMSDAYNEFTEEEVKLHLKDVTFASNQHNKLLLDILNWARIQMGKVAFNPEVLAVKKLIEEQIQLVEIQLKNKGLKIEFDLKEDLNVFGDREMVKTILRNLINNAIKFSNRDSNIRIEATDLTDRIEVRIIDFGVGMRTLDAEKIFDLSSKIQRPGTENESGTGFGLKLVAELVHKNQGTIRVESELGEGSSFILNFPSVK